MPIAGAARLYRRSDEAARRFFVEPYDVLQDSNGVFVPGIRFIDIVV